MFDLIFQVTGIKILKSNFGLTRVAQIVTIAYRHLYSSVHRPTDEASWQTKNQVSVTYFTGENSKHHPKVGVSRHFYAS